MEAFTLAQFKFNLQQIAIAASILLASILIIASQPFRTQTPYGAVIPQATQEQVVSSENLQEAWNTYLKDYFDNDRTPTPYQMGIQQQIIRSVASGMQNRVKLAAQDPESALYRVPEHQAILGAIANAQDLANDATVGGTQAKLVYTNRDGKRVELAVSDEELKALAIVKHQAAHTALIFDRDLGGDTDGVWLLELANSRAVLESYRDMERANNRADIALDVQRSIDPTALITMDGGIH